MDGMEIVKALSILCLTTIYVVLFLTQSFDVAQSSAITAGATNGILAILTLNYAQRMRKYRIEEKGDEKKEKKN